MLYTLTSIDTHLDFGFGIMGKSYYNSAEFLHKNMEQINDFQQKEMPMNFLYRHSIELFLKFLIVIFHKQLKLPYDTEPFDSVKPKILIDGKWRELYTCHWIDELYKYWLNELLLKHKEDLEKLAPQGEWQEDTNISKCFPLISKFDSDSSFFRYPVTKNTLLDAEKYTMRKIDTQKLEDVFSDELNTKDEGEKKRIIMLLKNDEGEIVDGFEKFENVLGNVTEALNKVSYYFICIHAMTRFTLCNRQ